MNTLLSILPFVSGLTISLITIPVVRWISFRSGLVATPRPDRWHAEPTPLLGGVSIFLGFAITTLGQFFLDPGFSIEWSIVAAASLVFLLGLLDDFVNISPPAKLIGQIFAASIVVFFGRNINFFPYEILNIIFTFIWLVGISNAINLLDNMDGLAGGVAFIAAGLLSYLFWQAGRPELLVFTLAIAGSVLGFLLFNFPPASIFMGDSGSLFLGFSLAALAIARVPRASNVLAVLGVPTMLFLLPILDTTLVTITRLLRGQSPARGGRDHTSHRLIAFGLSERQAVLVLYAVTLIAGIAGTAIESLDYSISLLLIPFLIFALALFTANLGRLKIVESAEGTSTRAITKLVINITARTRILEIALDFLLISISYYLAFWTYAGFQLSDSQFNLFIQTLPIALASAYTAFFIFGIYRGVWVFVSLSDLLRFGVSSLGALPILYFVVPVFLQSDSFSNTIIVLFGIFVFLGLAASRASFRIFDQLFPSPGQSIDKLEKVLIVGADQSSEFVSRWLTMQSKTMAAVGFIDDDPFKKGRQIHGIQVVGGTEDFDEIAQRYEISGIIIPFETNITEENIRPLIKICKNANIWVKQINIQLKDID